MDPLLSDSRARKRPLYSIPSVGKCRRRQGGLGPIPHLGGELLTWAGLASLLAELLPVMTDPAMSSGPQSPGLCPG